MTSAHCHYSCVLFHLYVHSFSALRHSCKKSFICNPEGFSFHRPGLTWSYFQKNGPAKQKLKVISLHLYLGNNAVISKQMRESCGMELVCDLN